MSKTGRKPVVIPSGVKVSVSGPLAKIEGPKGKMECPFDADCVTIKVEGSEVIVTRKSDERKCRERHGLYRALISSMVTGVHTGYVKTLELIGVGYKAAMAGNKLALSLGYSHPIEITPPAGITITVEGGTKVLVAGVNSAVVGQVAANIKELRPCEPYKGKGIKYAGEYIRRKAGKAAKAAGGAK